MEHLCYTPSSQGPDTLAEEGEEREQELKSAGDDDETVFCTQLGS